MNYSNLKIGQSICIPKSTVAKQSNSAATDSSSVTTVDAKESANTSDCETHIGKEKIYSLRLKSVKLLLIFRCNFQSNLVTHIGGFQESMVLL